MGTQEEQSIEELGAEVSTSVLTPLRFLERSAARLEGPARGRLRQGHVDLRRALRPRPARRRGGARGARHRGGRPARRAAAQRRADARADLRRARRRRRARPAQHAPRLARVRRTSSSTAAPRCWSPTAACRRRSTRRWRSSATTRRASSGSRRATRDSEYEELLEAADPIDLERPDDERDADLDQLHLGHHRQAQGRDDQPPRRLPARARRDRRGAADAALELPVDAPDVPLQRLGVSVGGHRDGRQARLPAEGRGEADLEARSPRRA